MTKIGLLTCNNMNQDLGCCSAGCLHDARKGKGKFAPYGNSGGVEMIGIITCAGCPTTIGHEKILSRASALADCGAEAIHISTCMDALCPFVKKYERLLSEHMPNVKIVRGSHAAPSNGSIDDFKGMIKGLLAAPRQTLPAAARQASQG